MEAELAKAQEGEGNITFLLISFERVLTKRSAEIEPFDTKLAQRVQKLSADIEEHTLALANLRRTAPTQTSQRFEDAFAKDSESFAIRLQKDRDAKQDEARNAKVGVDDLERIDEIQSTWQNGTNNLASLKSGLGGTVAKLERAQQAVDVLEGG